MSRARNIKPGFFKNDRLAECSPLGRILFVGLWCEADREGRLEDRPRRLKAEYLPYDDADVDALLDDLQKQGFIIRYLVGESRFISVLAFTKHQNPHVREPASTIPAPGLHSASTGLAENCTGSAGLIPLSPSLIPDSMKDNSPIGESSPATAAPSPADAPADESATEETEPPGTAPCPVKRIIAVYHETLPMLAAVRAFPEQSEKMLRARWRSDRERQTVEWWRGFFEYVKRCPFLVGEKNDFQADLMWLVRPTNFAKVINGNYENRAAA